MARGRKKTPDDGAPKPEPTKNDWTAQRYETRALSMLRPHPENAHKGDEDAIGESIDENGPFGVLGVQASTGYILHGNHTYKQLLAKGQTEFACVVYDVDDDLARRIMVAHNETQRGGKTDERKMADLLAKLSTTRGLGIRPPDVATLLKQARPPLSFLEKMRAAETPEQAIAALGPPPAEHRDDAEPDEEPLGGEDFEDEEAAGEPEPEEDEGDIPDFAPDPQRNLDAPRYPIPVVVSKRNVDLWAEYKKRIGERHDSTAFVTMLAATMNRDDGGV